jgi:hypothetical protein
MRPGYRLPARGQGPRPTNGHEARQHPPQLRHLAPRPAYLRDHWECGSVDCGDQLYPPDWPGTSCPHCGHPLVRPATEEF